MNIQHYEKVACICIRDKKVFAVLKKDRDNWQLPTTTRQEQETDLEALARVLREDAGVELRPETAQHFGTFEAHAHHHGGNPDKTNKSEVRLKCYVVEFRGDPEPHDPIIKTDFLWFSQKGELLQMYEGVMDELQRKNLIG